MDTGYTGLVMQSSPAGLKMDWTEKLRIQWILDWTGSENHFAIFMLGDNKMRLHALLTKPREVMILIIDFHRISRALSALVHYIIRYSLNFIRTGLCSAMVYE